MAERSLTALALSASNRETAATVPHATEPGKFGSWETGGRKYDESYKTACKSGLGFKQISSYSLWHSLSLYNLCEE